MNTIRVYIAAPWVRRPEAIEVGKLFESAGFEITSRWFSHPGDPTESTGSTNPDEVTRKQALEDLEDIIASDWVVVLNLAYSEGKAVETGAAIILGVPFVSVGKRGNVFQTLGKEVETVEEAIAYIKEVEGV